MALIGKRNHNQINTEKKFQLIICLAAYHKFHISSESARNLASQLLCLPRRLFLLFHQPVYSSHAFSTCRSILPTPSVPVLTLVTCRNALCTCPSTRLTPSPPVVYTSYFSPPVLPLDSAFSTCPSPLLVLPRPA